jgi:hypothetical protein
MLALCALTPAAAGAATPAPAPAPVPEPTPTALPPDLVALEQKMAALQITSLRFTLTTKVIEQHPSREFAKLLQLFGLDSTVVGEETLSPPAANVTLGLFGQPFTFRIIGTTAYLYFRQLGPLDGGRPWIRLGPGGFGELLTVEGGSGAPKPHAAPLSAALGQPDYAQPPFTKLAATLAGATAVSELGPGLVDGGPVTRFVATLRPGQLESRTARRSRRIRRLPRLPAVHVRLPPPPPKPQLTLEVSFANSGMPVQIVLTEKLPGVTTTATVDFPAINFPLTIVAPTAAETISVAEFKALTAKQKRRRAARRKHHKSKQ